jgi:hypothetical protein
VVFELKIEEFKPAFAGKMNFYLSAVDTQLKHADDHASIGVILCKGRNAVVVEYALRDTSKPMGVAEYRWTPAPALPAKLRRELPTTDDFAGEFGLLSMARLRIDVELALRELLQQRGVSVAPRLAISTMVRVLEELKLMPITEEFMASVRTLTSVVHGQSVEPNAVRQACDAARRLLVEIHKLIEVGSITNSKD